MPKITRDTFFADLSLIDPEKPFDGMSAGSFVDMYGRKFTITPQELPEFIANTTALLESTRDSAGEIVGLPIDRVNHAHEDAAGWITGVSLSEDGTVMRFQPRWNEMGRFAVGEQLQRFFSPSIDLKNKVVLGGSLTNWPASRSLDGRQIMLKPLELSQELFSLDEEDIDEPIIAFFSRVFSRLLPQGHRPGVPHVAPGAETHLPEEVDMPIELANLKPEERAGLEAEALAKLTSGNAPAELAALVEQKTAERVAQLLEQEQRKASLSAFAASLVGTPEKPKGIPVPQEELASFLSGLSPEQEGAAKKILSRIVETGLIDYQEHGHSQTLAGQTALPDQIAVSLTQWLAADAKNTVEKFFAVNAAELGAMGDYDLSAFKKE